jgi:hypothetical protein
MKNKIIKTILSFLTVFLLIGVTFTSSQALEIKNNNQGNSLSIYFEQDFSDPIFEIIGENLLGVSVEEANSKTIMQGWPLLPAYVKSFELPWGSVITNIEFNHSEIEEKEISKKIEFAPVFKNVNIGRIVVDNNISYADLNNLNYFPNHWFDVEKGVGLSKSGEHVLFLTFWVYPVRHNHSENRVIFVNHVDFTIEYDIIIEPVFPETSTYDLVIITPKNFKNNLISLVDHKNSYGVKTNLLTLEEIYSEYPGRDYAEKIKYFIKQSVEDFGIKYVLLVGDIRKLPIRQADSYPWEGYHGIGMLTDMYYSDIYDSSYNFSSWDTNDNKRYGEIDFNNTRYWDLNRIIIVDEVDLFADVHVGRLACRNEHEVDILVKKIIEYETGTYGKEWFKNIILAGGDTFSLGQGSRAFVYEGEITNQKVADELPNFNHVKLWSSNRKLKPFNFNREINKGAGFVVYAGHGFEHGWGTFNTNVFRKEVIAFLDPVYYTPYIKFLRNKEKLPVFFFDACLTAKLDFNLSDLVQYYNPVRLLIRLLGMDSDTTNYIPCLAWSFLIEEDGGGIGAIGATRSAYSMVAETGPEAGAGYLDWMFFKSYYDGVHLGEMLTQAQNLYMTTGFKDYFTIQEYLLLGDPSLRIGGYPPN